MNYEEGFLLLWAVVMAVFISVSWIDTTFYNPIASEKANQWCINNGYDTYDTYSKVVLSKEPLGIKCNYIKNRQEIITNSDVVAVVPAR